jgi:hypothetical protein
VAYTHSQEFFSVAISFVLYGAILLRIRGNLFRSSEGWRLRFVPKGESWKLAVTRDSVDQAVLKAAYALMWYGCLLFRGDLDGILRFLRYPVAYFFILLPISITRFIEFAGRDVPLWAQTVTAVIFNLTGKHPSFSWRFHVTHAPMVNKVSLMPFSCYDSANSPQIPTCCPR